MSHGWASARFGRHANDVGRAIDLYFAAYETVLSRDPLSSYGSPRQRAPLAILNDGILCNGANRMVARLSSPQCETLGGVVSQYVADPDGLTGIPADLRLRVCQDMFPTFRDPVRAGLRARTQSAAFARCQEQLKRALKGLDDAQSRQLFERFGYPAEFIRLSSDLYAEISCAVEAKDARDPESCRAHVAKALAVSKARDALDGRYNSGRWEGWYARDLVYPCSSVSESLQKVLESL